MSGTGLGLLHYLLVLGLEPGVVGSRLVLEALFGYHALNVNILYFKLIKINTVIKLSDTAIRFRSNMNMNLK
jgi:hypothetical protein